MCGFSGETLQNVRIIFRGAQLAIWGQRTPKGPIWATWKQIRALRRFFFEIRTFNPYSGSDSRAAPFPLLISGNFADPYGESARL